MSYASFTNSPASAKLDGMEASASFGKRGLTVLLSAVAVTEFIFVAIAAYLAAALYHWLILLYWPETAKYIPEALLIASLNLFVSLGHRQYSPYFGKRLNCPNNIGGGYRTDDLALQNQRISL